MITTLEEKSQQVVLYDKPAYNQVVLINVEDASIILKEKGCETGISIAFGDKQLADQAFGLLSSVLPQSDLFNHFQGTYRPVPRV